jgi:hypothetical protein
MARPELLGFAVVTAPGGGGGASKRLRNGMAQSVLLAPTAAAREALVFPLRELTRQVRRLASPDKSG